MIGTGYPFGFCANLKWLFTELPFLDRFSSAAEAGFDAVEYASPEYPATELRRRLDAYGLRQILINTPVSKPGTTASSGLACHPSRQAAFRDGMEQSIAYSHILGSKLIHLMAGIKPDDTSYEAAREVYLENVSWAAALAGSAGVRLVLEAVNQRDVPGFFLRTLEEGAEVIRLAGEDNVGLLFDIYHCQMAQGDVSRRLEMLMPLKNCG